MTHRGCLVCQVGQCWLARPIHKRTELVLKGARGLLWGAGTIGAGAASSDVLGDLCSGHGGIHSMDRDKVEVPVGSWKRPPVHPLMGPEGVWGPKPLVEPPGT